MITTTMSVKTSNKIDKTVKFSQQYKCTIQVTKKTKKCQPTARDTTDLIKTDCVPDSGLSRPPKKISERKTQKHKINLDIGKKRYTTSWKDGNKILEKVCYIKKSVSLLPWTQQI